MPGSARTIQAVEETFPERSFLAGLPHAAWRALEASGSRASWRAGSFLLHEGGAPESVLFILGGLVKVVKSARSGHEVLVELRRAGDVLGELGVLDGMARSASVVAVTDASTLRVPAARFRHLLREHPVIGEQVLFTVVARLRLATERQLELGTVDVVGRLCRRLVELAMEAGTDANGVSAVRHVSQQDLADWAGVSRDGIVRALKELRDRGWVSTGRQRIDVLDLPSLSRRAGG